MKSLLRNTCILCILLISPAHQMVSPKKGKGKGKAKALPDPVQPELDSSDEEILEALALGAQGK